MADAAALLTALTTEHFTLQGSRASTIGESTARAALFVGALSSALIALGLIAQAAGMGSAFDVFALVVLPVLYALGTFTFVRLVESSVEDLTYGRAINRIRSHYLGLAGDEARLFLMGAHDDTLGVLANMGITRPSRWQLLFTLAAMVAVLTAVVGGAVVAFVAGVLGAPLGAAAGIGGVAALASLAAALRWQRGVHDASREDAEVLFPSGAAAPAHPPVAGTAGPAPAAPRAAGHSLEGRRVVVVGGTSGMGLGVARAAAAAGAEVVAASRRPVDEGGLGTGITAAVADVTDEATVRALFEEHGPVDHLVVTASPGGRGPFLDQDVAAARSALDGKVLGTWACARYAAPSMAPGGSITFLSGGMAVRPASGSAVMSAAFAAVEALGRALALELGPIRVNTIRPGLVDSAMWDFLDDDAREDLRRRTAETFPARRIGRSTTSATPRCS